MRAVSFFRSSDVFVSVVVLVTAAAAAFSGIQTSSAFELKPFSSSRQCTGIVAARGTGIFGNPTSAFSNTHDALSLLHSNNNNNNNNRNIRRDRSTSRNQISNMSLYAMPPALPWVVGHVVAGAAGSPWVIRASRRVDGWYQQISLPSFTPPNGIFGPVWTILYASMGWSVSTIFQLPSSSSSSTKRTFALGCWAVHMVLNLSWAPLFFGKQTLRLGLAINVAMLTMLLTIILPLFYQLYPPSAYVLIPYTLWICFATKLNQAICYQNPTDSYGYNNAKFYAQLCQMKRKAAATAFT